MYVIKNSQSIYNIRPTCQSRCFLKVLIFKSKVVIIYGIEKEIMMKLRKHMISRVLPDSIAEELGLEPGTDLCL